MSFTKLLKELGIFQAYEYYKFFFYVLFITFLSLKIIVPRFRRRKAVKISLKSEDSNFGIQHDDDYNTIKYNWKRLNDIEIVQKSEEYYKLMNRRRTIRFFSKEPVPKEAIDFILKTAGTSPSGAHKQPWTFVVVTNPDIKTDLRRIVESEEEINYDRRMSEEWRHSLKPFKTNWVKQYIEEAPYIILVFKQIYSFNADGTKMNHYYVEQSVSIAVGLLISAIHFCGLATLTSTPLNCGPAISSLLDIPKNEKLVYLLPVGFPTADCRVPDIKRKPLTQIATYL